MTELDFDELDKAVNSLMGDKAVPQPKSDEPDTTSATLVSAAPAVDVEPIAVPQPAAPVAVPTIVEAKDENRSSSLAVKRRGQFMDMIHPSADMKSTPRPVRPLARVSRQGPTLSPTLAPTPIADPALALDTATDTTSASAWPDPIDLSLASEQDVSSSVADDVTFTDASNEPQVSPFIADAKVEKRPLGQAQPTGPSESTESVEPVIHNTAEVSGDLPAELSDGLLAVESNDLHEEEKSADPTPAPETVVSAPEAEAATPTPTPTPAPEEAPAQASIPPQYKSDDGEKEPAEHSALYDEVSNAHPAKPVKKKSGWLVPVGITGLVLLGCGGGIAVYYMMMG